MLPYINVFGKVVFYNGSEITGGTLRKAGYDVEQVLLMDEIAQSDVLQKVEQNRRLERAQEDARDSGGRSGGINFGNNSKVTVHGNVYDKDSK